LSFSINGNDNKKICVSSDEEDQTDKKEDKTVEKEDTGTQTKDRSATVTKGESYFYR